MASFDLSCFIKQKFMMSSPFTRDFPLKLFTSTLKGYKKDLHTHYLSVISFKIYIVPESGLPLHECSRQGVAQSLCSTEEFTHRWCHLVVRLGHDRPSPFGAPLLTAALSLQWPVPSMTWPSD